MYKKKFLCKCASKLRMFWEYQYQQGNSFKREAIKSSQYQTNVLI